MSRITLAVLLTGTAMLFGCNKQPAQQSPADYYRSHPEVPDPRRGSFTKSKPGKYQYTTPTDNPSGTANSSSGPAQ